MAIITAGPLLLYNPAKLRLRLEDWDDTPVKLALLEATYTPAAAHAAWAEVSAHQIAANTGYTAGGQALSNTQIVALANGHKFTSDNVVWTASAGSIPPWRYGVLYLSADDYGEALIDKPLIGYFLGDATDSNVPETTVGNTLTLTCPAGGWFDVT